MKTSVHFFPDGTLGEFGYDFQSEDQVVAEDLSFQVNQTLRIDSFRINEKTPAPFLGERCR